MKRVLKGTVDPVPMDPVKPPLSLRVRIRLLEFPDDVQVVDGVPLSDPIHVRVIYDSLTPMRDAARLAAALRKIASDIDGHVAAIVANGGRVE